jgi:hypothetical protein
MHRRTTACWIALVLVFAVGAAKAPSVVESWLGPADSSEYKNFIVIGITDDQEIRHHFEDKFVSHLRGHGVKAVTSHSLVPDLEKIENRNAILNQIMEKRVDAAISVRLIPLDKSDKVQWADGWAAGMDEDTNLRLLIEETLPVQPTEASRFGLEIAVWETEHRYRVWAGRTDGLKKKQLAEGAGDFVEYTIQALSDAGLLP